MFMLYTYMSYMFMLYTYMSYMFIVHADCEFNQLNLLILFMSLSQENRVRYNQQYYKDVFNDPESIKQLDESVTRPSLLQLIEVSKYYVIYKGIDNTLIQTNIFMPWKNKHYFRQCFSIVSGSLSSGSTNFFNLEFPEKGQNIFYVSIDLKSLET